jgi:hypothetical protein
VPPQVPSLPPASPGPGASADAFFSAEPIDVGAFRQGTEASRWALSRYLVGRAIGDSITRSLLVLGLSVLALAGLLGWAGAMVWAVLVGIVALGILTLRALLAAVLRRLGVVEQGGARGPVARRGGAGRDPMRRLVRETRRDVLSELRRVGLPGHTVTLPLLALRLLSSRRRPDTLARLRGFRVDSVVTAARLDELHLVLRNAPSR